MICNMLGMAVISYTTSMHLLTQVIVTSTSNLPNVSIVITLCIQGACESRSHVAMNIGVEHLAQSPLKLCTTGEHQSNPGFWCALDLVVCRLSGK